MAKKIVLVLGIVFVLIGVAGIFNNPILGYFAVDQTHNIIHLVSGALALIVAMKGEEPAKMFARIFGVVYGLVAVLGFVVAKDDMILGLFVANMADHILHVVIALVFLFVGFSKGQAMGSNA